MNTSADPHNPKQAKKTTKERNPNYINKRTKLREKQINRELTKRRLVIRRGRATREEIKKP